MSEYENVKPRFEYRTFQRNYDDLVIDTIRNKFECTAFRQSSEVYIMSTGNSRNNTKLRDNKMDIKCFVQNKESFEQWNPLAKFKFPLNVERITTELFPAFSIACPKFERSEYTQEQFLEEIIKPNPQLSGVEVLKRRFATTVENCITEYAEVEFNGSPYKSISIESTEIEDLKKAKKILHLDRYENLNYLVAIKRAIGMRG